MSGTWGNNLEISLFGESHGPAIGVTINGLPAGLELDMDAILIDMARRAPGSSELTTPRKEKDQPEIITGFLDGKTTGAPLTAIIWNTNTRSKDYSQMKRLMRPGQADYPGRIRYSGFNDYRGSGHFSGRITAPLVFAGAICKQLLAQDDIVIGAHVQSIAGIEDQPYDFKQPVDKTTLDQFKKETIPLFDESKREAMEQAVLDAKADQDSVGGVVEVFVQGMPAGYGNPFFDSVESTIAHLVFAVPATKGLEFGSGFDMAKLRGSQANDRYYYDEDGNVQTETNHNGGILGGITFGMPIVYRVAVKAPASIEKEQTTINVETQENDVLSTHGRHDPIIVPRIIPVLEAITAIGLVDLMMERGKYV